MTRLRGWRPRSVRLVAKGPHGHRRTLTFLAALRPDRIDAPCVFDGPIDGENLVPGLAPGEIVALDNLGSHKGAKARSLIHGAGCHLACLPPYPPDLNPTEQAFAKLKALQRKAEARSIEAIWNAIAGVLGPFSAQECTNSFRNAGYGSTQNGSALVSRRRASFA
jgi:transposase